MRFYSKLLLVTGFLALASVGTAQPPAKEREPGKEGRPGARPEGRPGEGRPGEGRPGGQGFGGRGGMMQPGQILPPFLVEQLKLTDDQKAELAKLQKETEEKINKMLTEDQRKQLKDMKDRAAGGDRGRPGAEGGRPGAPGERRPGGDRPPEKKQ